MSYGEKLAYDWGVFARLVQADRATSGALLVGTHETGYQFGSASGDCPRVRGQATGGLRPDAHVP
jgi:hypothetical protein